MTVAELIERLQELDPNLRVLVPGPTDGYDDVVELEVHTLCEDFHHVPWCGKHVIDWGDEDEFYDDFKKFEGVVLSDR